MNGLVKGHCRICSPKRGHEGVAAAAVSASATGTVHRGGQRKRTTAVRGGSGHIKFFKSSRVVKELGLAVREDDRGASRQRPDPLCGHQLAVELQLQ